MIQIESTIHFERKARIKWIETGTKKPPVPARIPHVAKLMALAIRFEELVRSGDVRDYAELARLAHVRPTSVGLASRRL